MSSEFDPYRVWLSIPANEQPANFYRLLGISLFESDPDVISGAADRQMAHVRTFQTGKYSELSQKILNELSQARITLLDQNKKASYDEKLHEELNSASRIILNGSISSIHNSSVSSINSGSFSSISVIGERQSPSPPPAENLNEFANAFTPSHSEHSHISKSKVKKHRKKNESSSSSDANAEPSGKKSSFLKYLPVIGVAAIASALLIVFLFLASGLSFNSKSDDDSDDLLSEYDSDASNSSSSSANQQQAVRPESERVAGDKMVKVVNGVEFVFRWCPPGTFKMGSPSSEDGRNSNETQHQVTLTRGFWMLESEVTVRMFKAFVNDTDYESKGNTPFGWTGSSWELSSKYSWNYTGFILDDNRPAACVSWDDAVEFNKWLGKKIGQNVQLPTEAQWEYACRAGSTTAYYWGDNFDREKAHYADNSLSNKVINDSNPDRTAKVKSYKPNAWGLYDMLGNVLEWCADCPSVYPSGSISNPIGPKSGGYRICRGGACSGSPEECRAAARKYAEYRRRAYDYGFRCAIVADVETTPQSALSAQQSSGSSNSNPTNLKAGSKMVKTVNGFEYAFRWCPPGTFMMGSPENEDGRKSDEIQHQVTLTKGFWLMETEVTVGMFRTFVDETGYKSKGGTPTGWTGREFKISAEFSWENPPYEQDDSHPVTCVSRDDVMAFCKWLGGKISRNVTLPTEAQWEYACRAGSNEWNSEDFNLIAWYVGNSGYKAHPVGTKKCNAWGLYDMLGNLWEKCLDGTGNYTSLSVTDPFTPSEGKTVTRGGSWDSPKRYCRPAYRVGEPNSARSFNVSFRCAIVSDDEPSPRPTVTTDKNAGAKMVKTVDGVEFVFHWCPAGTFMMGSPVNESGRKYDEVQHEVTLSKGFWMLETEVTVGMYRAFINDTGYETKANACRCSINDRWEYPPDATWNSPGFSQTDKHPVVSVSWIDATVFCKWLEKKTGIDIQLPTEAQWEYACRAGTTGAFYGSLDETGWYDNNRSGKTHPVRTKKPNVWGLYDMHGNVWEWCADWKGSYPRESVTDPTGPSSGSNRTCRGGGWDCGPSYCRSAMRGEYSFNGRTDELGFRCVSNSPFEIKSDRKTESVQEKPHTAKTTVKSNANRKTVTINGVEFAFIWCPAGTFTMGSPNSEPGHSNYEEQHSVTLTNGFWIMETEVTQKQWKAITGKTPSAFKGDELPVENISWNDCQEFCKICSKHGLNVQLPTEEQWEYACRAGTKDAFAGKLEDMGWYGFNSNYETHTVGDKTPNAWGLYDMHGNVWEWCINKFTDNRAGSSERHGSRVIRGGAWFSFADSCPSANRFASNPDYKCGGIGMRGVVNSSTLYEEKANAANSETLTPANIGVGSEAGERRKLIIKGTEYVFRWCPPGEYTMGSPEWEYGRCASNERQRAVTISEGFWIMETEVTQKQWAMAMGNNPSYFKGMYNPVEKVTWNDCQVFCKKTGLSLPSEEQWEYACRAGTTGTYAGDDIDDMAWYASNCDSRTHVVGLKEPNPWGLYDMHGNVWEWCSDKDSDSSKRVVRGGCWFFPSEGCRSAIHGAGSPNQRNNITGFRCIIMPQKSESSDAAFQIEKGNRAGARMVKEINGVEFAFRWCPAGTFMMGSPESEKGREDYETRRKVTLTKGFWIMETEVTQEQFEAIMGGNPSNDNIGDNLPVEWTSWKDGQVFCQKCRKLGLPLKLPTEAQWEYACRAGTTGPFAGNLDDMAWYSNNSDHKSHPVGTKKPNAWGIYDMHGNIMEWCQDWHPEWDSDYDPTEDTINPKGAPDGMLKVSRGGYYNSDANDCRSARHDGDEGHVSIYGFRCVIDE